MIPVWIINFARERVERSYLKQLYTTLPEQKRTYWYYTEIEAGPVTDEASCRLLLDELIAEGRDCYNHFQKNGFVFPILQICLVGTITEPLTRTVFHLAPSLLRDYMPAIQSGYVHRGVEITGLLFVPHNLNQYDASERAACALFAEELNTLVTNLPVDSFNRVVVCQDIQRPDVGERYYGELNARQQTEFVYQLLLHLYYCGEKQPKLFDAQELNAPGFYALGAASVYYDSREHKDRKAFELLKQLTTILKDPSFVSDRDTEEFASLKFPKTTIAAETLLGRLKENCSGLQIDLQTLESMPDPHPITGFYKAKLYTSYYLDYLKFMPARALEFTRLYAHILTKKITGQIEQNKQQLKERFETILHQYDQLFTEQDCRYPTFAQLKAILRELKLRFENEKEQVERVLVREERAVFDIPQYLSIYYQKFKTEDTAVTEKELAAKMKDKLKWEPAIMAVLNRSFLLGTIMVFVLMPILRHLSPFIINLGDIDKYAYIWITFIFLLPFLYQFGVRVRRHFLSIRNFKRMLLAKTLVKVQQKVSSELYRQTADFYAMMMNVCDEAVDNYERIEQKLRVEEQNNYQPEVPCTSFNQPLIEGAFNGRKVVLKPDVIGNEVFIDGGYVKLSDIRQEDYFRLLKEIHKKPEMCLFGLRDEKANVSDEHADATAWSTDTTAGSTAEDVDVPAGKALEEQIKTCLEHIKVLLGERLKMNDDTCTARLMNEMMQKYDDATDLYPLFRMAGVNGVITDSTCEKGTIIRSYQSLIEVPKEAFPVRHCENDKETDAFVFVTTWSRPHLNKLNVSQICGQEMTPPMAPLPYSTLLTCFYAQYKQHAVQYYWGDVKIPVSTEILKQLEVTLNQMKP